MIGRAKLDAAVDSHYLPHLLVPGGAAMLAERVVTNVQYSRLTPDAVAFRGMSGAIVAPLVADLLGCGLLMVRKGEKTHSNRAVEGVTPRHGFEFTYIIVDDFVASGATLDKTVRQIREFARNGDHQLRLTGIFLYDQTVEVERSWEGVRPVSCRLGEPDAIPF